jgi:hypothetical protein
MACLSTWGTPLLRNRGRSTRTACGNARGPTHHARTIRRKWWPRGTIQNSYVSLPSRKAQALSSTRLYTTARTPFSPHLPPGSPVLRPSVNTLHQDRISPQKLCKRLYTSGPTIQRLPDGVTTFTPGPRYPQALVLNLLYTNGRTIGGPALRPGTSGVNRLHRSLPTTAPAE